MCTRKDDNKPKGGSRGGARAPPSVTKKKNVLVKNSKIYNKIKNLNNRQQSATRGY